MSKSTFGQKEGRGLAMGLKLSALVAVIGMVALAASHGTVVPDEISGGQSAYAASVAVAQKIAVGLDEERIDAQRDPSVPMASAVRVSSKDESAAPTF